GLRQLHLGGQPHHVYRDLGDFKILQNDFDDTGVDELTDLPQRGAADAEASRCRAVNRARTIRAQPPTYAYALVPARKAQWPSFRVVVIRSPQNTAVPCELVGVLGSTVRGEIGRRSKNHGAQLTYASGFEPGVGQVADAHGEVEALLGEIDRPIRGLKLDLDPW